MCIASLELEEWQCDCVCVCAVWVRLRVHWMVPALPVCEEVWDKAHTLGHSRSTHRRTHAHAGIEVDTNCKIGCSGLCNACVLGVYVCSCTYPEVQLKSVNNVSCWEEKNKKRGVKCSRVRMRASFCMHLWQNKTERESTELQMPDFQNNLCFCRKPRHIQPGYCHHRAERHNHFHLFNKENTVCDAGLG